MKIVITTIACALAFASCALAQQTSPTNYSEKLVYQGKDVEFRQIDNHTWHGHGNMVYNEAIYVIEGNDKALVIDAGTNIPGLRKIIEGITSKPVILALTHFHPDHSGSAIHEFDELWFFPDTKDTEDRYLKTYKGKTVNMTDGMTIDLGGRQIHVFHTPGHTYGSCTFLDYEAGYGFSGDSFGSTNLLLNSSVEGMMGVCTKMLKLMEIHNITKLYPGHYHGDNPETAEVLRKEIFMCEGILTGALEGEAGRGNKVLNVLGTRIQYDDRKN